MRWRLVMTSLAVLALASAACADGDGGGGVATLGNGESAAGASPSMTQEEALQAFGECMRENGIEDFQDPQLSEDGGIFFGGPVTNEGDEGEVERPSEEEFEELQAAMRECERHLPEGTEGGPGDLTPEERAEMQDAFLAYAQCMRDQGIDFPDPEFGGDGGGFTVGIGGDGLDPEDPEFQAADEACRPLLEDVGPGRGGEVTEDAG